MATPTGYDAICFSVVVSVGTTGVIGGGAGEFFLLQEINPVIKKSMKKSTLSHIITIIYFEIHSILPGEAIMSKINF
jgi:hypothetical protein